MKKIITAMFVVTLLAGSAYAQWDFVMNFPDDVTHMGNGHGLAVDPDGKIWYQDYYSTDSIMTAAGTYTACRQVFVYNPDGTPASFSGMKTITVDGVTDTLWNSQKGCTTDQNGNIIWTAWSQIWRINYQTGEGMNMYYDAAGSMTKPSVDNNGNIAVGPVIPGTAIYLLDPDFNFLGNVCDAAEGYARTLEISPDGNSVYWLPFTAPNVLYTRPDEFSPFAVADTNWMPGLQPESSTWHPVTGDFWASAGSFNNSCGPGWTNNTWYGIDLNTGTRTDSLKWNFNVPDNANERPRAIAFSPDGNTCYVACFGDATYPAIQKFERGSDVEGWQHVGVIDGYTLSQNYPNPFNPTTSIRYSVGRDGHTSITVYDMLGRQVKTLVNEFKQIGTYTVEFDATDLPSGTYLYELKSLDRRIVKKMSVVK